MAYAPNHCLPSPTLEESPPTQEESFSKQLKPTPPRRTKKWVARPLVTQCSVCYSPATDVLHYGAVACYSCRAFFRRTICSKKEYRFCSKRNGVCIIKLETRKNCKKCRFAKCLQIGMRPEKVNRNPIPVKKPKIVKLMDKVHDDIQNLSSKTEEIRKNFGEVNLDIGTLVDECFLDEHECCDNLKEATIVHATNNEILEMVEYTQEMTMLLQTKHSPAFDLTFEEDFRIHELMVRKENLFDGFYRLFLEFPNFVSLWERFLFQIKSSCTVIQSAVPADSYDCKMKNMVRANFVRGGLVRHALEMFDEFKNVPDHVKTETIEFSLSVLQICIRSYLRANKGQPNLIEQQIAAGTYNKAFQIAYDKVYPYDRSVVPSFDPLQLDIFATPWAVDYEDEVYFKKTVNLLGNIVKDDVKLGTLFMILILATPGTCLSVEAQADPSLQKLQSDISLLMYRYCKNKMDTPEDAANVMNSLLRLIPDLHKARRIHLFRRISLP